MNRLLLCFMAILPILNGCCATSHAQQGAMVGGGLGALTGAALASHGHPAEGALIGGLVGAAAGTIIGDSQDARDERDAAMAHAAYVETAAQALTNDDVMRMAANGLSEDVILTTIQSRGGRFDITPDGLIRLKSAGVSDRVIQTIQMRGNSGLIAPSIATTTIVPPAVVAVPGPPVILEPRPSVEFGFFVGPPPPRGPHFHHRHRRHW